MQISRPTLLNWAVLIVVAAASILLRVYDFPARYEVRDMDETGYCAGCLQLLEGITPGYKAAPAGPLFWAGWLWVGGQVIDDLVHPLPEERKISLVVRPMAALNRAMFDDYRDMSSLRTFLVAINVTLAIVAALAAAGLGLRYAGIMGGLLLGLAFSAIPVFLDLSEMSRPYAMAWSFGVISLFFASGNDPACARRRWIAPAVFLGLSIASRIEMLCLMPLVWWMLWDRPNGGSVIRAVLKTTILSPVVAVFVAPWLMTHLIGNLRTIATVRFGGPPGGTPTFLAALGAFTITNAMLPILLLGVIGLFLSPPGSRLRRTVLTLYTLGLLTSMVSGFAYGIHQHGAVFIACIVLAVVTLGELRKRWPIPAVAAVGLAAAFPIAMAVLDIRSTRNANDHDQSVQWIEQHVPAGTIIYAFDGGMRSLLPTPDSADALWAEVNDPQAWRKKVESGLTRFNLQADELPRALGEENLIQERGNRRKWFILGSRTKLPIPRYDIRIVMSSPVFGIHNLDAALKDRGGVVLWRDGFDLPTPDLGPPVVQWLNRAGSGVQIYCSADVQKTLK